MARKHATTKRKGGARPASGTTARAAGGDNSVSDGVFVVGIVLIGFCVVMSGVMVAHHLWGLHLPGCGEGSACAAAANSKWGNIPLGGHLADGRPRMWPVSFLGLAYFVGLLVAWVSSRRGLSMPFRMLIRFGALVSIGFVAILILEQHLCKYCLGTHAGNLAFWLLMERTRKCGVSLAVLRPVITTAVVFIVASAGLYVAESRTRAVVQAKQEAEFEESTQQMVTAAREQAASGRDAAPAPTSEPTPADHADAGPDTAVTDTQQLDADVPDQPWTGAFTGRWRLGPEKAAVRIVMFTDYQCKDCQRIEGEVRQKFPEWTSVSLSIKHFPMDKRCNPNMSATLHAAACWAAQAAEAVGLLAGNDAFWQMHQWLFDLKGDYSQAPLLEYLAELGIDQDEFFAILPTDDTLANIHQDIDEAMWLGLHFTPMVFINGIELKGVFARQAVIRAVDKVLAANPPPMTAEHDHPPPAIEKYISDWRDQYARPTPPDGHAWPRGPDDARVKIVVWGDYLEPYSARADRLIRAWMKDKPDVQYSFRHFPFDQTCNPVVSRTAYPLSCRASRAAEGAGLLGGIDAHWKMHVWLFEHQAGFSDDTLRAAAAQIGLDVDALFQAMDTPEVAAAIDEDARAGKPRLYRAQIPTIYANGKTIPRWFRNGQKDLDQALDKILDAAYGQ
ncbi:MAG: DsbA family protein [Phycisphaerae bacterium]